VVHHYGLKKFVRDAVAAGVTACWRWTLPPKRLARMKQDEARGIASIYLVGRRRRRQRIHKMPGIASGFIYYVSARG